jgi:glycosyltransferase family protein
MNIRYGKQFKVLRKIAKEILSAMYPLVIWIFPLPKVLSIEETIDKIQNGHKSICRFGDSEFLYIIDKINLPYQRQNVQLRDKLMKILKFNNPEILIGLPIGYHSMLNLKKDSRKIWRSQISWVYPRLRKHLDLHKVYFNASMTRLYIEYEDTSKSKVLFEKIKKLWEGRDLLIIEGEKSRLGVGNNLFKEARKIVRILGPAHNAFDRFDEILNEALNQSKDKLVLVAMGPTAKPLVYELAQNGFQALDIGNIDIEYEWYLRGVKERIKIPGKYTSEASEGRIVEDVDDDAYKQQIIATYL